MLPNFWSIDTAVFHSSLVKCLNFGYVMLFVSSGFLETEGLLLTVLINRGGSKDTGGKNNNSTH